ncbi:MAG: porin family protein [Campylobacterales bacterium]|nr:porin family protein [Campylobacterales bacterium]
MKSLVKKGVIPCILSAFLWAGGDIAPVEPEVTVPEVASEVSPFYVVVKYMTSRGSSLSEENAYLDGDHAHGIGLDIGYKFNEHFAIELAGTYGKNDVTRTEEDVTEVASAAYKSFAINLVVSQMITEKIGVFGKVGVEDEYEKVSDFGIDESDTGMDYAAGMNYEIDEHNALIAEYEGTTIDGLLGDTIYVGVEHTF